MVKLCKLCKGEITWGRIRNRIDGFMGMLLSRILPLLTTFSLPFSNIIQKKKNSFTNFYFITILYKKL